MFPVPILSNTETYIKVFLRLGVTFMTVFQERNHELKEMNVFKALLILLVYLLKSRILK